MTSKRISDLSGLDLSPKYDYIKHHIILGLSLHGNKLFSDQITW